MALISRADATPPRNFEFALDSAVFSDKMLRLEVVAAADASPADSTLAVSRKRQLIHDEEDGTSADRPKTFSKKKQEVYEIRKESIEEESDESVGKTKHKGSADLIEIDNPNLVKPKSIKAKDVDVDRTTDLSRREREELEKQRSGAHYTRLHEEGKTEQASKDLDCLTLIRQQREEAAKEREEEKAGGDLEKFAAGTPILRVKNIWVSSLILASESPFFYKLFTNGMKESEQKIVTLRVTEEEVDAVEDIISFIYKGKFNKDDPEHLLKILIAADKLQVIRAVRLCSELMVKSEMTTESAVMYLDFSCSNLAVSEALGPVKSASCQFLVNKFKEVLKFELDLRKMPLSAIRCIFRSSQLMVPCEDSVYDFLVRWVSEQYPNLNERAAVFRTALVPLIRFMHMSFKGLQRFGRCGLMADRSQFMLISIYALLYKSNNALCLKSHWNYDQRAYLIKPLKVTSFHPYPESVVYMDLSGDDCARMFPSGHINSEAFRVTEHQFFVRATCRLQPDSESPTLGLYVGRIHEFSKAPVNVDIEFAVRQKPLGDFVTKFRFNTTFTNGTPVGYEDFFSSPWLQVMAEDSLFVIDGSLHVRVQVRIKQP